MSQKVNSNAVCNLEYNCMFNNIVEWNSVINVRVLT